MRRKVLLTMVLLGVMFLAGLSASSAQACGGLFCQNSPVEQNAERIIFTQNADGTVSAIIQIQYTGFAEDFSWILPISTPITAEDLEVPETGMTAFVELEQMTNVRILAPPVPEDCLVILEEAMEEEVEFESAAGGDVEVFASGEVGPFGFDVIGSEDPNALIIWLRDNNYRVEEQMEPLINVYVEENFVFLAMRLLPDQGTQDIQPIKITYNSPEPMIPLRLTAVAANPDMAVLTWFFAEEQAVPVNYAHMDIPDDDLRFFFPGGGNNYRQLVRTKADAFSGRAFVTEYAGPSANFAFTDPLLIELSQKHNYLTRLNTFISPEEMTVDPVFGYDDSRPDISNVRDLSNYDKDLYECERDPNFQQTNAESEGEEGGIINLPFVGNNGGNDNESAANSEGSSSSADSGALETGVLVAIIIAVMAGAFVAIGAGIWLIRRSGG